MTTATTPTSPLVDKLAATTIDPLAKHYDGFAQRKLSQEDATAYAERLLLPTDVFSQSPSLDLLTQVQIAHLEQIAKGPLPSSCCVYDALTLSSRQTPPRYTFATKNGTSRTTLSVCRRTSPACPSPSTPSTALSGKRRARSASVCLSFCSCCLPSTNFVFTIPTFLLFLPRLRYPPSSPCAFASLPSTAINASFAAFLRNLDFRVSELVGRTFGSLGSDPLTHPDGWKWKTYTHELLVVDWEGSEDRWLVDGAWGPRSLSVPCAFFSSSSSLPC